MRQIQAHVGDHLSQVFDRRRLGAQGGRHQRVGVDLPRQKVEGGLGVEHPQDRIGPAEQDALQRLAAHDVDRSAGRVPRAEHRLEHVERDRQATRPGELRDAESQVDVGADIVDMRPVLGGKLGNLDLDVRAVHVGQPGGALQPQRQFLEVPRLVHPHRALEHQEDRGEFLGARRLGGEHDLVAHDLPDVDRGRRIVVQELEADLTREHQRKAGEEGAKDFQPTVRALAGEPGLEFGRAGHVDRQEQARHSGFPPRGPRARFAAIAEAWSRGQRSPGRLDPDARYDTVRRRTWDL